MAGIKIRLPVQHHFWSDHSRLSDLRAQKGSPKPSPEQKLLLPKLLDLWKLLALKPGRRFQSRSTWLSFDEDATIAGTGETVKASLRKVLADSHVAAIAIALLLAQSLIEGIDAFALPVAYGVFSAIVFVLNTVTEREFPNISSPFHGADLLILSERLPHLVRATAYAIAAWLLARWVYGQGPIHCLRAAWSELPRRSNASSIENSARR